MVFQVSQPSETVLGSALPSQLQPPFKSHEAARYIGMSDSWLRQSRMADRTDGPPFFRAGTRAIRYRRADLDRWLESRLVGTEAQPVRIEDRRRRVPPGACVTREANKTQEAAGDAVTSDLARMCGLNRAFSRFGMIQPGTACKRLCLIPRPSRLCAASDRAATGRPGAGRDPGSDHATGRSDRAAGEYRSSTAKPPRARHPSLAWDEALAQIIGGRNGLDVVV